MSTLMISTLAFIAGIKDKFTAEKGATATEYSLLVGLIALVLVGGVGLFGTDLNNWFNTLAATVGTWH